MKINKTIIGLPMTMACALAGASTDSSKTFALSAGWDYLVSGDAQDAFSSTGFLVEGSYYFKTSQTGVPISQRIDTSLDFTYDQFSGHGNHLNQYALLLTARQNIPLGNRGQMQQTGFTPYYGLGIGIVRNMASLTSVIPGQSGGPSTTVHASPGDYDFAAKALVGANITDNVFLEGDYRLNGSLHGARTDNITVSVGIRF